MGVQFHKEEPNNQTFRHSQGELYRILFLEARGIIGPRVFDFSTISSEYSADYYGREKATEHTFQEQRKLSSHVFVITFWCFDGVDRTPFHRLEQSFQPFDSLCENDGSNARIGKSVSILQ
eukprot:scaffold1479_cov127-Cylindrotheca_fusiformis.AAC.2